MSHFHDADRQEVNGSASQVLDTSRYLRYQYEDTSLPSPELRLTRRRLPAEPPPEHPAEPVGATEDAVELRGASERVTVSVGEPTGPAARSAATEPARVYLTVEGMESDEIPDVTYAVYVNLPDDADPDEDPNSYYDEEEPDGCHQGRVAREHRVLELGLA